MHLIASIFDPVMAIFRILFLIIFQYFGWVPIVAVLSYLIWQNRRREKWVNDVETTLLLIEVPKDNEKKELSAEQMFASLHGILRPKSDLTKEGSMQEHLSFEIVARDNTIQFYAWVPTHLKDFVESQIYAQYPTVQIREGAEDYSNIELDGRAIYGTELSLNKTDVLPIKTFASFEVDPLAGITAVLAKLDRGKEEAWIQVLARPIDDSWQDKGKGYIEQVKTGKAPVPNELRLLSGIGTFLGQAAQALWTPPPGADGKKPAEKKVELSTGQQAMSKAVEEKITKLGYEVKIRIAYLGPDEETGKSRMQAIVGGFKQFNTTNMNGFNANKYYSSEDFLGDYRARLFFGAGYTLNIEELASLYHLPHKSVETPNMVWTTSKTSEPPSSLPRESDEDPASVSLFGLTNFRGAHQKFGIKRSDRGRHVYIIGQTGAGKSMLLQLLTVSDVYHNQGFAIIDPHGDYATDIMKYIPESRLKDVVYFDATDREHPMAFNPMEVIDENLKNHIASELVGVLKRMFENSWGPRLEYILRYTALALLDYPGATMLDITRMLTEKDFRKKVIREIKDPVVRTFWVTEFASWNEKFASEAVAPVLNKVGAFVANPLVRNIIGQEKSAFNIREIMDQGKILIVNLSRGQVGEDNAAILGALMVTKIQLAAMGRADMALADRKPFYLYVDEFQNFATDSFAVIMSEARKYGLNLTVANQYVAQMPETVRDAVFGNVGTMITFRIGPGDSAIMTKYYEPTFEAQDITRLNNQNIFISMIINGEKAIPFSGRTLRMPDPEESHFDEIVELSRTNFASDRVAVEAEIAARHEEGNPATAAPVDQGARALDQALAAGLLSPAQAEATIAGTRDQVPTPKTEQEANIPKSEFLAALKNPNLPPVAPEATPVREPRRDNPPRTNSGGGSRDNRGGERRNDGRSNDRNRSSAPRRESGQGSGQRSSEPRREPAVTHAQAVPAPATQSQVHYSNPDL